MDKTLTDVVNALQQVIFEVVDSQLGKMRYVSGVSQWIKRLFPQLSIGQTFVIDDDLPFLQDFIIDAKPIWQGEANARLKSGFWTEVTACQRELHLEAVAIKQDSNNLLVISNLAEEFRVRQQTLQSARELLLSNDRLVEQNEYLHSRIIDILEKPEHQDDLLHSLTQAIEDAGFSVLIVNDKFDTLIENSATFSLFEERLSSSKVEEKPVDIIFNMLESQLPEFDRIMSTKSGWSGELCWMYPPSTLKWLKIALYPVKTDLNEIKYWIVFTNDISHIKHLVQTNEQLALQDILTKLPNRFSFQQTLNEKVTTNKPFYLLYLDINKFRSHNEYYGHDDGDKLLIDLSERITSVLSEQDYLARVGGDEYAIILAGIKNQHDCQVVIDKIFKSTNKVFLTKSNEKFNIQLSIGAANFPSDASCVEELMRCVDLSAYTGRVANKNSLQFYSQSIKDASFHFIELEKELRHAINNQEFELYLQPIVNVNTNTIEKAEALIRWNHPIKGLIFPASFIPEAEKSDLINAIGRWVIKAACVLAKQLNDEGHKIKISINLSPSQVSEDNLFSFIESAIEEQQVNPELLELEVTEGVLVNDYDMAESLLSKVRGIGMSVSVDDFGTGYSSLAYLKKLPLDFLKIDRSFVNDIVFDNNDRAIVRAVISMAKNLNLGVTVEGVETEEQLTVLRKKSCHLVQGYYFSKPVPLSSFLALMKSFH